MFDAGITVELIAEHGDAVLITDAPYATNYIFMKEASLLWQNCWLASALSPNKLAAHNSEVLKRIETKV